jgi:hypothetical protein
MIKKKGIFESTNSETKRNTGTGRGRPLKHEGQTQNITVIFDEKTADQLRMTCIKMKKPQGGKFSMNEFIRPIIEAVLESGIDLTMADNESELKEFFLSKL